MENTKKQSKKNVFPNPAFLTGGGSFGGKRQPFRSQFEHNTNAGGAKTLNRAAHQTSRGKKKGGGGSLNLRAQTCRLLLNRLRGALALNAAFNIIPSLKLQARWGAKILMILIMTWNGTAASLRMIFLSRSSFHYDIDGELVEGEVERYATRRHAKASACILVMTLADWLWHTKLPWLSPIIMYPFIIWSAYWMVKFSWYWWKKKVFFWAQCHKHTLERKCSLSGLYFALVKMIHESAAYLSPVALHHRGFSSVWIWNLETACT